MGMTDAFITVKNPADPSKEYTNMYLVDSGATFTVVPGDELRKIGVKPTREESFSLVDGKVIKRKIGNVLFEYEGVEGAAPVIFGEKDDAKLLGAFTLEALGLVLDPLKRTLHKAHLRM
jgi:predicted aspartyl protease